MIGLDKDRKVTLPNMTACQLLQRAETDLIGNRLEEVAGIRQPIASGASRRRKFVEEQIILTGEGSRLTLRARIATEKVTAVIGYVVTFDDVTDLLPRSARRPGRISPGGSRMKSRSADTDPACRRRAAPQIQAGR